MMKRLFDDIAATFPRACRRLAVIGIVTMGATILGSPPAAAQNGSAWLSPESPEALESSGEVVITVSMWRAGRVAYRTVDGSCQVSFSPGGTPPDTSCSGDGADSPEDYTATSGELIFATGGSQRITVPIVHDSVADSGEAFTLIAWEEANADPWIDRGDSVIVRIYDEVEPTAEESAGSPQGNSNVSPAASGRSSASPAGAGVTTLPSTSVAEKESAATPGSVPSSELATSPGAGGEPESDVRLTNDGGSEGTAQPTRGRDGSRFGLAALVTAALGVGVLAALLGRHRRGSAEHG